MLMMLTMLKVVHDDDINPRHIYPNDARLKLFDRCSDILAHHGNHEVEQTDGLDEGKAQDGVGKELTAQSRVARDAHQQGSEDETDTNTSTTETNGGGTHTHVLGDLNHGLGDFGRVVAARLVVDESLADVGLEDVGRLLALQRLEGSGRGSDFALRTDAVVDLREGPLGSSVQLVQLEAKGWPSSLGGARGHGGGQSGGEHTRGGHCAGGWRELDGEESLVAMD